MAREACHSLFFMKFMKCNIRALPFSILKIYKIGKEQVKDGRKRKILYRIEGQRKEKYFTHDLKQEHTKVDKETGEMIVVPSREDSYERLLEAEKQFAEETEKVEDVAVRAVMLE